MDNITITSPKRARSLRRTVLALAVSATGLVSLTGAQATPTASAAGIDDGDWLGILNVYRAQSDLPPVTANTTWSAGAQNHSCWMLLNGIAHDEGSGTPGYSSAGDAAGNNGNVAVTGSSSSTARYYIDLWMSAPFHAIGVLRPRLQSTGFGACASPPNPSWTQWKSSATLDVLRGVNWAAPRSTIPVVFPGDGATTSLTRFIAESPDPRTFCGWGGRTVGLPLIAMMPSAVSSASATLSGPNGPVSACVLHGGNTSGTARSILGGDNAVVVVPSAPLAAGAHAVTVTSSGGNVAWTFNVDPDAPLGASTPPAPPEPLPDLPNSKVIGEAERLTPATPFRLVDSRVGLTINRLPAKTVVRVPVAGHNGVPADTSAISANFTVADPAAGGHLTAYDCTGSALEVSTLNYPAGAAVANQSIVPLAANGDLCLYSYAATDVVIDVNGFVTPSGTTKLNSVQPTRVADTRGTGALLAGVVRAFDLEGGASPVPDAATGVIVNLTSVDPQSSGWIRAYPCDLPEPGSSTLNVSAGMTRANSAIIPTSASGTICLRSTVTTDIVIDVTGWVGPSGTFEFTSLQPIRMADTRSLHPGLNPAANGQPLAHDQVLRIPIAGTRGVPIGARAATLNVVSAGAAEAGYLRIIPCGGAGNVSTVNYLGADTVANGATVELGADGDVCVTTSASTHVIVDITGIWS